MNQHQNPEEAAESAKDHLRAAAGDIKEAISGKTEDIRQTAAQKTDELRAAAQGKAQQLGGIAVTPPDGQRLKKSIKQIDLYKCNKRWPVLLNPKAISKLLMMIPKRPRPVER